MDFLELSKKDLHDLAKGWYLAKHINNTLKLGKEPSKEQLKDFFKLQSSKQTSLSQNVTKFICVKHDKEAQEYDDYLTKDSPRLLRLESLSFEKLTKGLEIDELKDEDKVFLQSGRYIQRVSQVIHNYLLSIDDFSSYESYFGLLEEKKNEIFNLALKYHLKDKDSLFSFSYFVPFIERNLQQLLFQYHIFKFEKDKKEINYKFIEEELIPGKLSELLDHKDLKTLLGVDICFLLRLLIGPLNSINLRNVTIHGFMSQDEWYEGYTSMIFMLMFSLGPIADSIRKQYPIQAKMRPFFDECIGKYKKEMINEKDIEMEKIIEVFDRSTFVLPPWKNEWKEAIINYQKGEYYHCLVRLFPIIEHAIRRIYVCANNCAERLLTAEQKSLYTTLDILLVEDMMFDPNKKTKNLIFDEIGVIFQNAIYDMFLWNECPRLRDMLSHGGINPFELKRELADWVLSLGLGLIVKYDIYNTDDEKYYNSLPKTLRDAYLFFIDKYEPIYHPKSVAERIVDETKDVIRNYQCKNEFPEILDEKYKLHIKEVENETNLTLKTIQDIKILDLPLEKKVRKNDYVCKNRKVVFYGVIVTEKEYRTAVKIREVITYCMESLIALDQSYSSIYKVIADRKSTTQNRKHLSHIITYSPTFSEFFKLVSHICEYEVVVQNDDPDFVNKLYNVTGSVQGCIKKNMYRNGFEVVASFIIPPKNVFDIKYIVVHKKFVDKSFGDFQGYKFVKK